MNILIYIIIVLFSCILFSTIQSIYIRIKFVSGFDPFIHGNDLITGISKHEYIKSRIWSSFHAFVKPPYLIFRSDEGIIIEHNLINLTWYMNYKNIKNCRIIKKGFQKGIVIFHSEKNIPQNIIFWPYDFNKFIQWIRNENIPYK